MSKAVHRHQMPRFQIKPIAGAVAAAIATASTGVHAEPRVLEEVVVTATKRSESLSDVPLAITALSGDFTKNVNINDVKDLVSFTPGVSGNSQDSFIDAISVRGIRTQDFGVGGDPSTAFFKNDLYEGRNGSAVTSLFDMERSEVLRGANREKQTTELKFHSNTNGAVLSRPFTVRSITGELVVNI